MSDTDNTADKLIASVEKSQSSGQSAEKPSTKRAAPRKKASKPGSEGVFFEVDRPRPSEPETKGYSQGGLRWPD
jgi:hypothetical protein